MLADGRNWIIHEVRPAYTAIFVVPDEHFNGKLAGLIQNSVVVRVPGHDMYDLRVRPRAGWWCVPATTHLLGIRSCALRPDRLVRNRVRQGGMMICAEPA